MERPTHYVRIQKQSSIVIIEGTVSFRRGAKKVGAGWTKMKILQFIIKGEGVLLNVDMSLQSVPLIKTT